MDAGSFARGAVVVSIAERSMSGEDGLLWTGDQVKSNSGNVNVGAEFSLGAGNVDQGGNKANGRACTFGASAGTCN